MVLEKPWKAKKVVPIKKSKIDYENVVYTEADYGLGELNLLKMEKEFIIKALTISQRYVAASNLLKISKRSLERKIKRHQIKLIDWRNTK